MTKRCIVCNRELKSAEAIQNGMGYICKKKHMENSSVDELTRSEPIKTEIVESSVNYPQKEAENLVSEVIKNSPFASKVYSVGGFVRDDLLNKKSKDLDLVVESQKGSEDLSKYLHSRFSEETSNAHQVGEGYPIWRIAFRKPVTLNGKTYNVEGVEIDIADTQKEAFPDPESRQRITTYGTLDEDICRRDFTCNMLLRDLTTGKIIDKSGSGIADLKEGILRGHPKVSLDKIFSDDPLRMIRLLRFHSKYNWKVPLSVIKTVKRNAHRIEIVSNERIRDEFIKIMEMGKLAKTIKFMKVSGLLKHVFPEVHGMIGVNQDKNHHSEGDVFVHTLLVTEKAKPTVVAQMSALLHDVGKPSTQKVEGNRVKFYGHEDVSSKMSDQMLKRLKVDTETTLQIKKVVAFHLRGHFSKDWTVKAVRKYIRDCGPELNEILDLTEIDGQSSFGLDGKPKENVIPELRNKIKKAQEIPIRSHPVLTGDDIMSILKIKAGPVIGESIKKLRDLEDEFAEQGKVLTKEDAESFLINQKI
jgi:poly(A) polymerase